MSSASALTLGKADKVEGREFTATPCTVRVVVKFTRNKGKVKMVEALLRPAVCCIPFNTLVSLFQEMLTIFVATETREIIQHLTDQLILMSALAIYIKYFGALLCQ